MSHRPAVRQRTAALPFRRTEWNLLVQLPGRVVVAAIYDEPEDGDEAPVDVLDACRTAGRLLTERVGRVEADAYRQWLLAIATRVCHAARTGGLLGVGVPADGAERRFLADLAASLRAAVGPTGGER
jgi:hypothetical protein